MNWHTFEDRQAVKYNDPKAELKRLVSDLERLKKNVHHYEESYKSAKAVLKTCRDDITRCKDRIDKLVKENNLKMRKR
jgi:exonuclease VII small subunit